ncbi:MAG: glycosyltransferase family 4 protein [candidate division NC10 bacterium]|nr:glycosyltransferase family 4 protein [candidate division NC10 bacterium]
MRNIVVLLGRRDQPTDGVEDYCERLAEALGEHGYRLQQVRVAWADEGWGAAYRRLWSEAVRWRGGWALVQYTALSWSRRGFPTGFLLVLAILKRRGCRVGVVFHDPEGFPGSRWIDWARRAPQHRIMRAAYALAEQTVHNVPVERVGWLPRPAPKAVYIPVGANVPAVLEREARAGAQDGRRTVAVFCVTGGSSGEEEVRDIARALGRARRAVGTLRLVAMGRGSREAEGALQRALDGVGVELSVMGVLPAGEVSRELAEADALLFVRGPLSSQRTSAIGGLACGLPVVGYSGMHTGPPLTEAGLLLAPYRDSGALADGLTRVLSDRDLWQHLHERSVEAYRRHFSWEAIATRYIEVLGG